MTSNTQTFKAYGHEWTRHESQPDSVCPCAVSEYVFVITKAGGPSKTAEKAECYFWNSDPQIQDENIIAWCFEKAKGERAQGRKRMTDLQLSNQQKYHCIVADPPWQVKRGPCPGKYQVKNGKQIWDNEGRPSQELSYPTLSVEEICQMRVGDLAAKNAHLYLWAINSKLEDAYRVARAWGFEPSTVLVWAKNPLAGLGGAFKISTEYVLFCRRGTLKTKRRIIGTWWNWKRPYNERGKPCHSMKPPAFMDMVEQVSPGPYLELFARRKRDGWSKWGNEVTNDVELSMETRQP